MRVSHAECVRVGKSAYAMIARNFCNTKAMVFLLQGIMGALTTLSIFTIIRSDVSISLHRRLTCETIDGFHGVWLHFRRARVGSVFSAAVHKI